MHCPSASVVSKITGDKKKGFLVCYVVLFCPGLNL